MKQKEAIKNYEDYMRISHYYQYVMNEINFEDVTDAPKKNYRERNEIMNYFSYELFKRNTSIDFEKRIEDLNQFYPTLDKKYQRIVDLSLKDFNQNKKIPSELMKEYQKACSEAYHYYILAKEKNDYQIYKPYLKKVLDMNVLFAKYYGKKSGSYYNTFLDLYEEDIQEEELDLFFQSLKERILPLLEKIKASSLTIKDDFLKRPIDKQKQMAMAHYLLKVIGFDEKRGMLKETEHPFTERIGLHDVRITTHIYPQNFISNLYSVIHEGGHGIYEQNIDKKLYNTILFDAASMSIHESQSRFYENIIGRSYSFCKLVYPTLQKLAHPTLQDVTVDQFYQAINKVSPSFIRTEADELTYSLHILIRYEMEKMLIRKELDFEQLPAIWNQKYKEYLGIDVQNDRDGILQDVHWSSGIGYFFSYALGNAYAAQIYHALQEEMDVDQVIQSGNLKPIKDWLKQNIYQYGKLLKPKDLIKKATKESFNPKYYCDYLEEKYTKIYHLK